MIPFLVCFLFFTCVVLLLIVDRQRITIMNLREEIKGLNRQGLYDERDIVFNSEGGYQIINKNNPG